MISFRNSYFFLTWLNTPDGFNSRGYEKSWGSSKGLLQHAARRAPAGIGSASRRYLLFRLNRFRFRFFGTFALALRAMGNVLPAGAEDVIAVFLFNFLVVFERKVAVVTKKGSHIRFWFIGMGHYGC